MEHDPVAEAAGGGGEAAAGGGAVRAPARAEVVEPAQPEEPGDLHREPRLRDRSDGFSDADGSTDRSCPASDDDSDGGAEEVAARASPPRAFPPPLPSLARRTVGRCR